MIELRQINKTYGSGAGVVQALKDIDLTVRKAEIFGIIGHSGAGKSTLIRTINLLERPTSGQVMVDGTDITSLPHHRLQERRRSIGMIFQHFNLLSSLSVHDNIAFPLRLSKQPKAETERRVKELIGLVGLEDHADKHPAQLSGGQKQRVGIARALATNPKVLLCDEATSALDPQTTQSILALLLEINHKLHITIVLITHEMQVIRAICDRVAVLDGGTIVESGDVASVFLKPQHRTTKDFVAQASDGSEAYAGLIDKERGKRTQVKITFIGKQTYEPVLYETMKEMNVPFAILQGTISRLKDTPYGQLIVELHAAGEEADRTLTALRDQGLDVEVLTVG
ncbi:methionine ABC transporter ATP-binding protein [Paenibacillus doosanensis]|uniref:methionine ABC transporter ATP-binding protein n=1 Tax=Paenibacillus doosanensis TaxID=1229154 RepID=UPI0021801B7E|nr:methionine ABC transporter ATP-binding protein [Paenibacillus doosanensis]MCS7458634.1 methionine ABC transporter ATP-binding protein [Paenibacillus doosanensis]